MNIVESIANLINEDPDDVRRAETPSQIFSQVFLHDPNAIRLPLEDALERLVHYGRTGGMDRRTIQAAIEYTKRYWDRYHESTEPGIPRTNVPEQGFDPDQYSDRGY